MLPRAVASRAAFENAMALDIAMGGSTNTILHLLAAAQEAEVDFDLDDINAVSRRVPCLAKVAPNVAPGGTYYMEDVHRAGGIPAILGELVPGRAAERGRPHRAQRLDRRVAEELGRPWRFPVRRGRRALARGTRLQAFARRRSRSPSAGRPSTPTRPAAASAISSTRTPSMAVWLSSRATWRVDGCVVKTAGVDESIWTFEGPAVVCESQEEAVEKILAKQVTAGRRGRDPVRGSQGWSGDAGDALPDLVPEGPRAWARSARWSPTAASPAVRSGLSIGHASPEAASGGTIALVEDGDRIRDRHPRPLDRAAGLGRGAGGPPRGARWRLRAEGPRAQGVCRAPRVRRDGDQRRQGRSPRRHQTRLTTASPPLTFARAGVPERGDLPPTPVGYPGSSRG